MKNKEKYDLNTLDVKWTPQTAERRFFTIKLKSDDSTVFSKEMTPTETGTSAYNAWLEQEYKPQILDEKEKEYLSAVIKPFRKDVECIEKSYFLSDLGHREYIRIYLQNYEILSLPSFEATTMYKGMEEGKCYTLEELGL